jgi:iron complex outermembrane recepter protein
VQGTNSGNPNLTSETAYSKTFGVVLQPHWVQNLHLSVDYIDIALEGAISSLTLQEDMQACYDSTDYPNSAACGTFTRNPTTHQVTDFHSGYVNAGLLEFAGIQAALDYTFALPRNWGNVRTGLMYLDTQKLTSIVGSASPNILAGEIGTSKSKSNIDLRYMNRGFYWDTQAVFIGSAVFDTSYLPNTLNYMGVGAWWLINSTVGMQFTPHFGMQLIVNNVFDKQPPVPAVAGVAVGYTAAASTYFEGFLGRNFLLSADYKF